MPPDIQSPSKAPKTRNDSIVAPHDYAGPEHTAPSSPERFVHKRQGTGSATVSPQSSKSTLYEEASATPTRETFHPERPPANHAISTPSASQGYGEGSFKPATPTRQAVTSESAGSMLSDPVVPLAPTPEPFPGHRDTLFSVISGYGHSRSDSNASFVPPVPPIPSVPPVPPRPPVRSLPSVSEAGSELPYAQTPETEEPHTPTRPTPEQWANPRSSCISEDSLYDQGQEAHHPRDSVTSSDYEFPPPPRMEDIEAIARQPSPGRVEHGIPLQSRKPRLFATVILSINMKGC